MMGQINNDTIWKCLSCGKTNEKDDSFCVNCGTENEPKWTCRNCEKVNDCSDRFCVACGIKREIYSGIKGILSEQIEQKNKNLKIAFIIVLMAFIVTTGILCVFTQGLINNILITLASCIVPAAIGIGLNSLGNSFRNNKGMQRFLHIFGSVFHCVCPIILMLTVYYTFHNVVTRPMAIILAFSLSFLGYIPAHYNKNNSLMKNNILGVINLFSTVFMWSFIASNVGCMDAFRYAQAMVQSSLELGGLVALLFKVGTIFMLLQALKLIIEEFDDVSI